MKTLPLNEIEVDISVVVYTPTHILETIKCDSLGQANEVFDRKNNYYSVIRKDNYGERRLVQIVSTKKVINRQVLREEYYERKGK